MNVAREDWTLLAINCAGGSGLSPVQLQKCLFLLGQELPKTVGESFYTFRAYNYGPFALDVYHDAEGLEAIGLVNITQRPGQNWNRYTITDAGSKHAADLETRAPSNGVAYLHAVVDWAKKLSFQQLVRSIYRKYPEFKENSVFQG